MRLLRCGLGAGGLVLCRHHTCVIHTHPQREPRSTTEHTQHQHTHRKTHTQTSHTHTHTHTHTQTRRREEITDYVFGVWVFHGGKGRLVCQRIVARRQLGFLDREQL